VPARDFEWYWSRRIGWDISSLNAAVSRSKQGNGDYVRW
jgi:hypothetical protein